MKRKAAQVPPVPKGTVKVRVTEQIFRETFNERGRREIIPFLWNHTVKSGGQIRNPGDVFEMPEDQAAELLAAGSVQKVGEPPAPHRPAVLDQERQTMFGVVRKSDAPDVPTRTYGVPNETEDKNV